jgi:hypothetical protein
VQKKIKGGEGERKKSDIYLRYAFFTLAHSGVSTRRKSSCPQKTTPALMFLSPIREYTKFSAELNNVGGN